MGVRSKLHQQRIAKIDPILPTDRNCLRDYDRVTFFAILTSAKPVVVFQVQQSLERGQRISEKTVTRKRDPPFQFHVKYHFKIENLFNIKGFD